jgi:ankyrin repeat protein
MVRPVTLALLLFFALARPSVAAAPLADAAMNRDNAAVSRLLATGADVNLAQADGATALHWAAYHGDAPLAESLLEAGANVAAANRNGSTPLWLASSQGDAMMVETLLDGGADANEALPLGRRPLMLAARSGSVDTVRVLLEAGADPNAKETERGTNALMQAADQGHADVITLLVEHGADVAAGSAPVARDGRTAALGKSNDPRESVRRQVISVLCEEESPNIDILRSLSTQGSGATEDALLAESTATAEELCSDDNGGRGGRAAFGFGGEDDEDDAEAEGEDDGDVAAQIARADAQLRANAGLSTTPPVDGSTVAEDDAEADAEADSQAAGGPGARGRGAGAGRGGFGGGRGRAPREPDGGELTPLVYAARAGHIEAAQALLDAGASVNQTTRYGWSPLLAAAQNRNYQMGVFLIENGADVNLANKGGWTPLYLTTDNRNLEGGDYPVRAADMDDLAFIRLLLDKGANPNARLTESTETRTVFTNQWLDENGATAFLRASQSGDIELMRLLLDHGADPHINTELGVTPLAAAAGIGWVEGVTSEHSTEETVEAVKLLLELGIDPNHQADTGRTALHGAGHKGSTEVVRILVAAGGRMDVRDFGNTDNRGSPELAAHTWLPVDYADGLVRVGVQSAIGHPETAAVFRELMEEAGLEVPPVGRTLETICIVDVCSSDYDPVAIN